MSEEFNVTAPQDIPAELWQGTPDAGAALSWHTLDNEDRMTVARKIDLVGRLAELEKERGLNGHIDRVCLQIEDTSAKRTVEYMVKVYNVFRRPSALGWSAQDIARHSFPRLRAIADKREWALENPSEVSELLEMTTTGGNGEQRLLNERDLAAQIGEKIRVGKGEGGEPLEERKFRTLTFRVEEDQVAMFEAFAEACRAKHVELQFSTNKPFCLGQTLGIAVNEWLGAAFVETVDGEEIFVQNADYIKGRRLNPDADAMIEETARDGQSKDADAGE